MTVKEKVAMLRAAMQKNAIEAFIVYSSDPHASEYLPEEWQERAWLSGFSGSAGLVVVTQNEAGLWTDGRYFTQAEMELKDSGIDLFKDGREGTPNYIDWIISQTSKDAKVAVNALTTTHLNWQTVQSKLETHHRRLVDLPLLTQLWVDRPQPGKDPVFVQPVDRSGQSVISKINVVRAEMKARNTSLHIISALDDIAWMLNLRGSDVDCNPVFLSYLMLSQNETTLFVDKDKLNDEAKGLMAASGIQIQPYTDFLESLKSVKNETILIAPSCNQTAFHRLEEHNRLIVAEAPAHLLKAIKNKTELEGFRNVMVRDGVAMVKFLHWLTHQAGKESMTEYSIGEKLLSFRKSEKNFAGISFTSIVGLNGNGAIIHYAPKKEGSAVVSKQGSILIDSGGQYLEGTSDITRTLPLGNVSETFKRDATLVLKGHIQLALAKFPKGTRGDQLDAFARMSLWKEGKDYNHGTGHGVGSFLNVHEGPQSIRKDYNSQPLVPGMVISNEPGYYEEGHYGIRHENLVVVKEWKQTDWNMFYELETLTLCPFFNSIVIKEMLVPEEIQWLNDYHKLCAEKLSPYLEGEVKAWLEEMTQPI